GLQRRAYRSLDAHARPQAKPANLGGGNINVFGTVEVIGRALPQETESVEQDLKRAPTAGDLALRGGVGNRLRPFYRLTAYDHGIIGLDGTGVPSWGSGL